MPSGIHFSYRVYDCLYKAGGIVAVVSVALNVLLVIAILLASFRQLLPSGMAALVLTIGMAVDANILIFERIREELKAESPEHSLEGG